MRFLGTVLVSTFMFTAPVAGDTPSSSRWLTHLTQDLLPFWDDAAAAGAGTGSFPGNLCNDGSLPVAGTACTGVTAFRSSRPQQTLVGQSRQVFSYAIAYHMTGQKTYLDLAKAGLDYQFQTFLDEDTGLFHETYSVNTDTVSSAFNSQKQAYGLLGAGFVYYLTGDQAIYDRIKPVQAAITAGFRNPDDGSYTARLPHTAPANTIAHHLDQLNTYKTLLAAYARVEDRDTLLSEALQTARYLKDAFYDPSTGVMRGTLDAPHDTLARADFGHSIKSFWFIDQTAKLAGDTDLERFAQDAAKALFKLAYQEDLKAWATGYTSAGEVSTNAHWWGFAELNQYAASLAISDPELRDILRETQAYWLERFVDPDHAGIWGFVDIATGMPNTTYRKHWEWKAGFHSYEHALINYLSDASMAGEMASLFFARDDVDALPLAYGFSAGLLEEATDSDGTTEFRLSNISFQTAAPVPLPAGIWLLVAALFTLRRLTER